MKYQLSKILWGTMLLSVAVLLQVSCISEPTDPANTPDPNAGVKKSISEIPDNPMENLRMDPTTLKMLANLRAATAKYHDLEVAIADGYAKASDCVAVPNLGGMGFHYVNFGIVDGIYDPTQPEALLYEMDKNGNMKLVGVEFIVVKAAWGEESPYFGHQEFDFDNAVVLEFPNYQLHVWVWRHNPSGMFTKFNPQVECLVVSDH